jgi:hypothetical protein
MTLLDKDWLLSHGVRESGLQMLARLGIHVTSVVKPAVGSVIIDLTRPL